MTSRRLPDPELDIENPEDLVRYLSELVRLIELELSDLNIKDGLDEQTERLEGEEITTGGNIARGTSITYVNASASAIALVLPAPLDAQNEVFYIKKINTNANNVTITVESSGTVDRSITTTLTGSGRPAVKVHSDGTEYWII